MCVISRKKFFFTSWIGYCKQRSHMALDVNLSRYIVTIILYLKKKRKLSWAIIMYWYLLQQKRCSSRYLTDKNRKLTSTFLFILPWIIYLGYKITILWHSGCYLWTLTPTYSTFNLFIPIILAQILSSMYILLFLMSLTYTYSFTCSCSSLISLSPSAILAKYLV
jgi:hypothetical protein